MNRRTIPAKAVKELLAQPGVQRAEELSEYFATDVYQLPDGRVLYRVENGRAILWPSVDKLRELKEETERRRGKHPLYGVFSPKEFPRERSAIVQKLSEITAIAAGQLNFSLESLKRLDRKVCSRSNRPLFCQSGRFEPLLAYVGEVLINHLGGAWELKPSSWDNQTLEPWLVNTSKGDVEPYKLILKELTDTQYPSLHAAVLVLVHENRDRPGPVQ